ncbi:MAG: ribosome biogenesis GTP-binding protein YihA/YsxC [Saccharofermentans sp.]|nr:ribosome biogenesis GTP-binding protein YihA/YsxC [Saccharofermentans sp.]
MQDINYNKTKFIKVAVKVNEIPVSGLPEVVLSGRSNVGKSSLINALANNKKLAKVSQTPGKTREIIYFNIDDKILLTDLPGYGYSAASKSKTMAFSELCDNYFRSGREFALVLHLIDIRHEPSANDKAMLNYLNSSGIPYFLVFTKCDKLSRAQVNRNLQMMAKNLDFSEDACVFAISSQNKAGLDDLKQALAEYILGK